MAGLTGRMSTVVKAKVSKLLDRAEDPAETLDYSYQKQVEQLQNVKKGIADVVTAKKRLQMQEATLKQSVVKLDTQARQAVSGGQEDLARTALERKNVAQTELQGLDKVTARTRRFAAPVGESTRFGTLEITVGDCLVNTPDAASESAAYLTIVDHKPGQAEQKLFAGWMFASTPSLSALDDGVYDVRVLACTRSQGSSPPSSR